MRTHRYKLASFREMHPTLGASLRKTLDGGHVLFLLYEMVTGKPPHEKFMEYAQMTGMILLLGLLILANGNDLIRSIFD